MQATTRFRASWLGGMALVAMLLGETPAHAAAVYSVNFGGASIDLTGAITVNSLGSFFVSDFDFNVLSCSIMASNNGAATYVFTAARSRQRPHWRHS